MGSTLREGVVGSMRRDADLIAQHFADIMDWFAGNEDEVRGYRMSVRICFGDAVKLAEDLTAIDLSAPAGPIGQWVSASRWLKFHRSCEYEAREMMGGWGMLHELPHWSMFEGTEDSKRETKCWPGGEPYELPSPRSLIRDGIVTDEWIKYLGDLTASFNAWATDCEALPATVPEARSLLVRMALLTHDLLHFCLVTEYAWFLHRPPGMPRELEEPCRYCRPG